MKYLLAIVMLFSVVACAGNSNSEPTSEWSENGYQKIYIIHYPKQEVTCWMYADGYRGGLSCLPDKEITQ